MRHARSRSGATKVEYALMVGLISVFCVVAVSVLGNGMHNLFFKTSVRPTESGSTSADAVGDNAGDDSSADPDSSAPSGRRRGNPSAGNAGNGKQVGNYSADRGR